MSCTLCDRTNVKTYYAVIDVLSELQKACDKYVQHPSLEHSMFVLQEEFSELKREVYVKEAERNYKKIYNEAVQVAAMALRLLIDGDVYEISRKDNL